MYGTGHDEEIAAKKEAEGAKAAGKKRKAADAEEGAVPNDIDWAALESHNGVTLDDMKGFCKLHSLKVSGTKAVLFERIRDFINNKK